MLTIEEIIKKLEPMNLTKVAQEIEVPYGLLWRVVNQKMTHTSYEVVKKLSDYIESL